MPLRARHSPSTTQLDRAHLGRADETDELEIVRAEGSWLFDADGNRYIDFVMGWCVGNLGWNPPELRERLRHFAGPDYVTPSARYRPWGELASLLAEITPGQLTRVFCAVGGSEAVELALQAAEARTGRKKFVAVAGAYHGNTIGIRALGRHTIKPRLDERALDRLETLLKKRDFARCRSDRNE